MLGLVFSTWEKYLAGHFDAAVLQAYREALAGQVEARPLAGRVFADDAFMYGLQVVSQRTGIHQQRLLRQFGHYFITNGLTRHHCAFLLSQTSCARDLVLLMRDAHIQMAKGPDGLTPPVFNYTYLSEDHSRSKILFRYDSPRALCGWFWGAVEGAAERFKEKVYVKELSCVTRGAPHCYFEVQFQARTAERSRKTPEQRARWEAQQRLAMLVKTVLPEHEGEGMTLFELQGKLNTLNASSQPVRLGQLLEVLQMLQHAGLLASNANQPGDSLETRRYWQVPAAMGQR
ncbi:heme-NO-binding protein [Thermosporothrix hazakensis]|jgi:hypothetical protein|uniref:Heme-NO-binding protein n=1 Tax=Thermosporothrix hazakensis TaxID=644383 RepID=A0A326U107_THEHA|nr:heme NO-binding domain-containing protein [Thermosporothrix hazakensis]PZW23404.1 heme-NO-binding protein [Thermosporothrix hazakensis]GCE47938.1 hypothetical protein KTH_28070 [Thermosporothrix hazakensis]